MADDEPLTLSDDVTYTVSLSTESPSGSVLLDRVVTLPLLFQNASSLIGQEENQRFQATCDVINNDMKYAHLFSPFIHKLFTCPIIIDFVTK